MTIDPLWNLPDGWESRTLADVCAAGGGEVQTGPFGSQLHASDYVPVGVPSIMPVNIGDNRINTANIARVRESDAERLSRYRVKTGDVVYSRRGDVERRALVRLAENGWLCGTGCLRVRFGGKPKVDPLFASYYLGHPAVRRWIVQHAIGATMPNLNTGILESLPFVVPPIEEQLSIASILGSLDDKIELNRRMNETLEAMAQALFKSWFVDFDPVRAHMDVRKPSFLSPSDAALFPGVLDRADLAPLGWTESPLNEIATVIMGASPPGDSYNEAGIGMPLVNGPMEFGPYFAKKKKWTTTPTRTCQKGDLVFCVRGSTTGRRVIADAEYVLGRGVAAIRARNGDQRFVNAVVEAHLPAILTKTTGSVFPNLSKQDLETFSLVVAPLTVRQLFHRCVDLWLARREHAAEESEGLAMLRDALLPRLMSGELRISDAAKAVQAVA